MALKIKSISGIEDIVVSFADSANNVPATGIVGLETSGNIEKVIEDDKVILVGQDYVGKGVITISGNEISANLNDYYNVDEVNDLLDEKQDLLLFSYDKNSAISAINGSALAAGQELAAGSMIKIENGIVDVLNDYCTKTDYSIALGSYTQAKNYSISEGYCTVATGEYSHAEGKNTNANREASHSEGSYTTANGNYSHAEGYYTLADDSYAHAEGCETTAKIYAHTEGCGTLASSYCHAEGGGTHAIGSYSHTEGYGTFASGVKAHAEGDTTNALGDCSHSEGEYTIASGHYSHAEGYKTTAYDVGSHTEGRETQAIEDYSHAEGIRTTAAGVNSHAEGDETYAYGSDAHAEGRFSYAIGQATHAEGENTTAFGLNSHSEGWGTIASADYSHAEGYRTVTIGDCSHSEGKYTYALGDCSHSEGTITIAKGDYSHTEGENTTALGLNSHTEGLYTFASDIADHIEGIGGIPNCGGVNHVEGFQLYPYTSNSSNTFAGLNYVEFYDSTNWTIFDVRFTESLYDFVKAFKDRMLVANDYSNSREYHFAASQSLFKPDLYKITNVTLNNGIIRVTLDRTLPSNIFGGIYLLGPTTVSNITGTTATLSPNDILQVYKFSSLGFPGNNLENIRIDNTFIRLSYNYSIDNNELSFSRILKCKSIELDDSNNFTFTTEEAIQIPDNITNGRFNCSINIINGMSYGGNHIEGVTNKISNAGCSHIEGYNNLITNKGSHAEGEYTTANGLVSHTEGTHTTANGDYSHAEGYYTSAIGKQSHAAGYYTYAAVDNETVVGKYNLKSVAGNDQLFVVGNGTTTANRSNAFAVRANGEASATKLAATTIRTSGISDIEKAIKEKQDPLYFAGQNNTITAINFSAIGVDLSNYYTKAETSAASEINDALDLKEDKVFVAEYNVTPYADIKAAYDAGKQIICKYINQNNNVCFVANLTQYAPPGNVFMFAAITWIGAYHAISCNLVGSQTMWQDEANDIPSDGGGCSVTGVSAENGITATTGTGADAGKIIVGIDTTNYKLLTTAEYNDLVTISGIIAANSARWVLTPAS